MKRGLADMLRGGVIMDVVNAEQAKVAEDAGAVAVMALERVPSDIRRDGGVARMSDPELIEGIQAAVTIPVMAKARIGHFAEAQVLESLGVDFIDESEVLTPADEEYHIDKWGFGVPFVCGATDLGEALRRISEGAAMIRSKGEAGTGNIVEAMRHLRSILRSIRSIAACRRRRRALRVGQAPLRSHRPGAGDRRIGPLAGAACSAPAASPRRPMPRWSCSSGPRPSSWVRASSRARTRPAWRRPSSRPRRTSPTPTTSPRSRAGSAKRCVASSCPKRPNGWLIAGGNRSRSRGCDSDNDDRGAEPAR